MTSDLSRYRHHILSHFKCQSTGVCCKTSGYVYVTAFDIKKMATFLNITVETFQAFFVIKRNGWSVIASPDFRSNCFLNENQSCHIYHLRPKACRTYPDWDFIWKNDVTLLNEASKCKGLKNAITFWQESV
tara:strand:- start:5 stop:397 length:393 start_codon:yes stop_codon:yes gene_type:complete